MRIGILGGTFNPVHFGHLRAAEEAREKLDLHKILFIPSGNPPLKSRDLASAAHRYKMVHSAIAGNRSFDALDLECARPGKSYTVKTLEQLREKYKAATLFFLTGIDTFLDIPNWWNPEKLVSLVNFAIMSRPDCRFAELSLSPFLTIKRSALSAIDNDSIDCYRASLKSGKELVLVRVTPIGISSSMIRKSIQAGMSVKYLLPEIIESYIISNKLYRKAKTGTGGGKVF